MNRPRPLTPLLVTDIIAEMGDDHILVIKRKYPPLGFALPGGHVDLGETIAECAVRELKEETGIEAHSVQFMEYRDDPTRDPRDLVVSMVFIADARGQTPVAGDDAAEVGILDLNDFKQDVNVRESLCFDHAQIIENYLLFREKQL